MHTPDMATRGQPSMRRGCATPFEYRDRDEAPVQHAKSYETDFETLYVHFHPEHDFARASFIPAAHGAVR